MNKDRVKFKVIQTKYWVPGDDYYTLIINAIQSIVHDGDIIVISEKAIAMAKGNIVDEASISPSFLAYLLSRFWMRIFWGYCLGYLCRFKILTLMRLRKYPIKKGSQHKQLILNTCNTFQALKYGSEGGIDISNVPFTYACIPLHNPQKEAQTINKKIFTVTKKRITVIITDTDSTFSLRNFHFTNRPSTVSHVKSFNSPFFYIIGRFFKLKQRATPIATAGLKIDIEDTLHFSDIAHHARGHGAGRTIWDASEKFKTKISQISWEMLKQVDHYPIVVIRREYEKLDKN